MLGAEVIGPLRQRNSHQELAQLMQSLEFRLCRPSGIAWRIQQTLPFLASSTSLVREDDLTLPSVVAVVISQPHVCQYSQDCPLHHALFATSASTNAHIAVPFHANGSRPALNTTSRPLQVCNTNMQIHFKHF